jgi:signal transduction histidine kinase
LQALLSEVTVVASELRTAEILQALAAHLRAHREAILAAWRQSVDTDPHLPTASTLSKRQFIDHIPKMLDTFEQRLAAESDPRKRAAIEDQKESAAAHGLQRWQQGYNQRETARDWGHLHLCLLAELENYESAVGAAARAAMAIARRALVRLINDGVSESASQYAQMRQSEAAAQVAELERGLQGLTSLSEQRADGWREATHDLRGSVGVLQSVSTLLDRDGTPDAVRSQSLRVLKRSVQSLHELLTDLVDLARLDAGQDQLYLDTFDAAAALRELCESLRQLATERSLFLRAAGPAMLEVQGDRVKILRIVQNLLLNALRYTPQGGVTVEWQAHGTPERPRWQISIADSGPGITQTSTGPIAQALEQATREAHRIGQDAQMRASKDDAAPPIAPGSRPPRLAAHGEGIGLAIVKRLCELLEASLELESHDTGTTCRVSLPRQYS